MRLLTFIFVETFNGQESCKEIMNEDGCLVCYDCKFEKTPEFVGVGCDLNCSTADHKVCTVDEYPKEESDQWSTSCVYVDLLTSTLQIPDHLSSCV